MKVTTDKAKAYNNKKDKDTTIKGSYVKKDNKPKFEKIVVRLGESEFYNNESIRDLFDVLEQCSFKKCAVSAKMRKSLYLGDFSAKGFIEIGNIIEWDPIDEAFTISVTQYTLGKLEALDLSSLVMVPSVRKNREGVISYIATFDIQKGRPVEPIGFEVEEDEEDEAEDDGVDVMTIEK